MMKSNFHLPNNLLALCSLVIPLTAQAQTPADAGQLLQQIERERGTALPQKTAPEITPAPQPMKAVAGVTVTVTAFRFAGNTLLSSSQLAPVVAEYLNRPVSFAELQQAAAAVAAAYRKAGWIVRAYLPQQDIQNGTITIQIVEAVFGGARLEGNPPLRLKLEHVLATVEAAQPKGAPLNAEKLDRALLLLDDLPGVTVSGSLRKGKGEHETDLILKTTDELLANGEVGADNTGARSTGRGRITGNLYLNSPLGIGDLATVNLIRSHGSDYGRLAYSIPAGSDGWRIGVSGSSLNYNLVADDFRGLDAYGNSSTVGLDASYPIIRSRLKNLYLGLNYDRKRFNNEANHAITTDYDIDAFSASLNGNLFDNLGGGGANNAGLTLTRGDVSLGRLDLAENASLDGHFTKLRYYLSRQQVITNSISAFAALSGQAASTNLDSAEKFYLGGAYGVRAYPANEGGGADGQLVNLELRGRLPHNFKLTGFYDLGHIRINHDNTAGANPNSYTLKGAGLALGWQAQFGLNLKAIWARRIGDNPNPAANGNDQDGSLTKNRVWLTTTLPF